MTLGKVPYPTDGNHTSSPGEPGTSGLASAGGPSSAGMATAPLPGGSHEYTQYARGAYRTCAYCGKMAGQWCETCHATGLGKINVCGRRSGRPCMDDHVTAKPLKHSTFTFSQAAKSAMLQKRNNEGAEDGDDEEDGPVHPIGSPLRRGAGPRH